MGETIKEKDFVEVDYTGKLADGVVFDTTVEEIAKKNDLFSKEMKYGPATICVGEKQILPGLDEELVGKELGKEYAINLLPEKAFGKRDIKKLKIVPLSTFKEHQVQPQPGLQIDIDGEMGTINRVSGGRVIVNFNHPLAGKEVIYTFKINRKIEDTKEKIIAFLNTTLRAKKEALKIEIKENKAEIELPLALPAEFRNALAEKLAELTNLKEIQFKSKEKESAPKAL